MTGKARKALVGYGFILPWLFALAFFMGYPFFSSLYFSFCDFPPLRSPMFVGLGNYADLTADKVFQRSLGVTMIYAAVAIPLGVILAMTLAMFLNARIRGQSVYRVVFYLPHLVPTVAVAILWLWIFNPQVGLVNLVLKPLVGAVDAFAALFFHLGGDAGGGFVRAPAGLLGIPPLVLLAGGIRSRRRPTDRLALPRFVTFVLVLATIAAAAALVHATLYKVMPADMRKLHSPGWLSDGDPMPSGLAFAPSWALWALIIMSMWGVGQMAVIYLAKLQDVPTELYEAAELDGANWWHKIRHVTIPMISPVILFNVVMAIIGTFQVFTEPYIMTGGGPEDKTRFVAMFVYDQAFRYHRLGYASAVAWALFVMIVLLTLLAFRISRRHVHYFGR